MQNKCFWQKYVEYNSDLLRPSDILKSAANPSKAQRKLGWRARYSMRDVARMMVEAELEYENKTYPEEGSSQTSLARMFHE